MKKITIFMLVNLLTLQLFASSIEKPESNEIIIPPDFGIEIPEGGKLPPLDELLPMIPFVPITPEVLNEEDGTKRILEETFTVLLESRVNVFVPLEILSNVDVKATVVDNQEIDVPFKIEMNKAPDEQDYYKLKFSEKEIDIDKDGVLDTFIYSPEFINSKVVEGSYVKIKGSGIKNEGTYKKKVYITVEVPDGHDEKFY